MGLGEWGGGTGITGPFEGKWWLGAPCTEATGSLEGANGGSGTNPGAASRSKGSMGRGFVSAALLV